MKFTTVALALSAAAVVSCAENPFIIPSGGLNFTAGETSEIRWSPTTSGTVSILLRSGAADDLDSGSTIVANTTNDGSYEWAVPSDIVRGSDYALEIISDSNPDEVNYTPQFVIDSDVVAAAATTSSSTSSAAATSTSSASSSSSSSTSSSASASATASASASASASSSMTATTLSSSIVTKSSSATASASASASASGSASSSASVAASSSAAASSSSSSASSSSAAASASSTSSATTVPQANGAVRMNAFGPAAAVLAGFVGVAWAL